MATWNSRGLRGSTLEEFINRTNEKYLENGLALQNIHEHQVKFMEDFEKQGGIAFFLVSFTARDEFYYLRLAELLKFWNRAREGGRKSFRREELDPSFFLSVERGVLVPYLTGLQRDLDMRD